MKKIYLLMAMLPLTIFAGLVYEMQEQDTQWKSHQFQKHGQYAPKYVAYSHEEFLFMCDRYNLVYNYESGQCEFYDLD